ncbi:restriction endonuclease subunit S [Mediterraneibacter glycyrrhizinilyticus]|nr:restriction endonuclease subunit S [Mediterraneibacter glycyrrhizinilyticus]
MNYLVSIPPRNEQHQIVSKIQTAFSLISKVDNSNNDLKELIKKTKYCILDLAIRGKLVPQDPNDESASVLLERIRSEKEELIKQGKIKRDKKKSVIFKGEDNSYYEKVGSVSVCIDSKIPFDLPKGWCWERLGNIVSIARGGSPRPIKDFLTNAANGINWIKIGDAEQGGKYIFSTAEKIIPEGLSKTRYVKEGDFLLTNSMSFGRPYILKTDGCIHDGWLVIGDTEGVFSQDFLYYALSSEFMYKSFCELAAGSTVKNLQLDTVKSVFFPIPPYAEQIRIAKYVEEMYSVIHSIEKSLS